MGRLVEGLWDCKYCNSKGIRGSLRECPNCGHPRDEDTKFYMPNKITYVPEEEAKRINRNPDWLCQYCETLNSDSDTICKSCGSPRTKENLDYFSIRKKQNESEKKAEDIDSAENYNYHRNDSYTSTPEKIKNSRNIKDSFFDFLGNSWKIILIVILSISLISGLVWLFIPKTQEVTVTDFSWARSIDIEKYQTVEESDWYLPAEARLKYSAREIHSYQNVLDHYETRSRQVAHQVLVGYEEYVAGYRDLGNGYFEEITAQRPIYETHYETEYYQEPVYRSEPVYKTKYYYEIDKWLYDRSLKSNGSDQNPFWQEVPTLPDNERVSGKTEKYSIVTLNKKGKEKSFSVPYDQWIGLKKGSTVKIKSSIFGSGEILE